MRLKPGSSASARLVMVSVCFLVLVCAGDTNAQTPARYELGLGIGAANPVGRFGNLFNTGLEIEGVFKRPLPPPLGPVAARIDFGYSRLPLGDNTAAACPGISSNCETGRSIHLLVGAEFPLPPRPWQPFVRIGIGFHHLNRGAVREGVAQGNDSDSDSNLGTQIAAGVRWGGESDWTGGFEVGVNGVRNVLRGESGDRTWGWWLSPRAFVGRRF
jgi:hypothetical protein